MTRQDTSILFSSSIYIEYIESNKTIIRYFRQSFSFAKAFCLTNENVEFNYTHSDHWHMLRFNILLYLIYTFIVILHDELYIVGLRVYKAREAASSILPVQPSIINNVEIQLTVIKLIIKLRTSVTSLPGHTNHSKGLHHFLHPVLYTPHRLSTDCSWLWKVSRPVHSQVENQMHHIFLRLRVRLCLTFEAKISVFKRG